MKIDSSHSLHRASHGDINKTTQPTKGEAVTQSTNPAAVTHLSDSAQDATQDVDTARVAEIRQAISEGRLDIRAERIADGLIDSVRDLLGDSSSSS